ncbi:Bug family tripartite tricarboxylate transporter substrate binding protein [Bosea sp. RAF48]|uniref:Bug family tripartite tricarboxylate transporter substrate binding protein n=1 Tax=Bosea sp. RAF48 TaxID=3237480 RepID=UPI003F933B7D
MPGWAASQSFPSRPIIVIVPFPPGGIADQTIRLAAERVSLSIGQPVIVDNKPGGGGQVGAAAVKSAAHDGHTLFLANVGTHAINASLYKKLSYDPVADFTPVVQMFSFPHLLAVPVNSPYKSVADLVAKAKADPGKVTFASQGVGSGGHLLGEMFKSGNKIDIVHVPYRGTAQAMPDLVAGRVTFMFDGIPGAGPQVLDGKLRALAITDFKRSPLMPDVPTVAEAGYPGLELNAWFGLVAPTGTPEPVVARLREEFSKAMNDPSVSEKIGKFGVNIETGTPSEFAAFMAAETKRLGVIVRESGAQAE